MNLELEFDIPCSIRVNVKVCHQYSTSDFRHSKHIEVFSVWFETAFNFRSGIISTFPREFHVGALF